MFVSFIVPVYKTGKYLDRCVSTLLNQDIDDYEILLIDDGSPDDSGILCDSIAARTDKIRVFHKKNEGLGYTRNFGIEHASGDYLIFVDSDDYFKENILGKLKRFVSENEPDIVVHKYERVRNKVTVKSNYETFPTGDISNKTLSSMCIGEPLKKDTFEVGPAWKEIWNKSFLLKNNLRFPSEREVLSEDYPFSAKAFYLAHHVAFFDEVLYYYCYNEKSLTNSYNPSRPKKAVAFYRLMQSVINEYCLDENAEFRNQNNFIVYMIQTFKHISLSENMSRSEKMSTISGICQNGEIKEIISSIRRFDAPQMRVLCALIKKHFSFAIYTLMVFRYRKAR